MEACLCQLIQHSPLPCRIPQQQRAGGLGFGHEGINLNIPIAEGHLSSHIRPIFIQIDLHGQGQMGEAVFQRGIDGNGTQPQQKGQQLAHHLGGILRGKGEVRLPACGKMQKRTQQPPLLRRRDHALPVRQHEAKILRQGH